MELERGAQHWGDSEQKVREGGMKEERGEQKGERKRFWERWEDSGRESDRKRRGMVGRERGVRGGPGRGRGAEGYERGKRKKEIEKIVG